MVARSDRHGLFQKINAVDQALVLQDRQMVEDDDGHIQEQHDDDRHHAFGKKLALLSRGKLDPGPLALDDLFFFVLLRLQPCNIHPTQS